MSENKKFVCDVCGKEFDNPLELGRHKHIEHSKGETKVSSFRLNPEVVEVLDNLSERLNMSKAEIVEKALENFVKYEMWNEGWELKLADSFVNRIEAVKEAKKEVKEHSTDIEIEKLKFAKNFDYLVKMKLKGIEILMKTEEDKAKLKELGNQLMNLKPEEILNKEVVKINGKYKLVEVVNGKPKVEGEIVKCYEGWYVKGSDYCRCWRWRDCLILKHKGLLDLDELKKQGIA